MRIVNFESQERVDLPDMTAVSFLVLGEFRKTVRDLMLGFDTGGSDKFIVRGFAVEPSAVPDARVRVRMDTGDADRIGIALLSENLGANTEFGQLVGGEDSAAALEGQAQQILDFAALGTPVTYVVEMRFTYGSGANDNRAKWNPGVNSEFIASQDTRNEPQWTARIVGAATGGEWIKLADVFWDGGTIDPADITDARVFAFEGTTPFQQATQDGTGGMADFDRTAPRGDLAVGINEVYRVMRALGRQVQDMKGPDGSGNWNWWARPLAPFSDSNDPLAAALTKNLASVDTLTYTIGDGVTTFGDFNGASGLETCLQHLETLAAQVPCHVRVVLKTNSASGFTWTITTAHQISTPIHLELIGRGGNGGSQGRTNIDFTAVPAASVALNMTSGFLTMRDLATVGVPAGDTGGFGATSGGVHIDNCSIIGSDAAPYTPAVFGGSNDFRLLNSRVSGVVEIDTTSTVAANPRQEGALISDCFINDGAIYTTTDAATEQARKITIRNTDVLMDQTHGFGRRGAIDLASAFGVLVENCRIEYVNDVDGVHVRETANQVPGDIIVRGTRFLTAPTAAVHAVTAGLNGTDGTGWGIYAAAIATDSGIGSLHVHGCSFATVSIDAGGIKTKNVQNLRVSDSVWRGCQGQAGTNAYQCLQIEADGVSIDGQMDIPAQITGCQFGPWGTTVNTRTQAIEFEDLSRGAEVVNCTFLGNDFGAPANDITGRVAVVGAAVRVLGTTVRNITFSACHFARWEPDTAGTNLTLLLDGASEVTVAACTLHDCGGYPISVSSALSSVISITGNTIRQTGTLGNGIDVGASTEIAVTGNVVLLDAGVSRPAADFTGAAGDLVVGNRFGGGAVGTIIGAPALNANNI